MPWKECHVDDERLRFVARLLDARRWCRYCAEFGISRKTGDRICDRYQEIGLQGLSDRSRRPYRHANQLPLVIEKTIVRLKREYPSWGAPKIRERLRQRCPGVQCPAISTVHAVLDRHGLVTRRKRRHRAAGTALSHLTLDCLAVSKFSTRQPGAGDCDNPGHEQEIQSRQHVRVPRWLVG
jgi:putative transposase